MTDKEQEVLNRMSEVKQAARDIIIMMDKYISHIVSEHLHSSDNPLKYIKEKWNQGDWKTFSKYTEVFRSWTNTASNKYFETFPNYWKGKDYLEIEKKSTTETIKPIKENTNEIKLF